MRIGVVPVVDESSGGIYQYSRALLAAMCQLQEGGTLEGDELIALSDDLNAPVIRDLVTRGWETYRLTPKSQPADRLKHWIRGTVADEVLRQMRDTIRYGVHRSRGSRLEPDVVHLDVDLASWLGQLRLDFLVFAGTRMHGVMSAVPYIVAVHDLQHRLQPHFPEILESGGWESREYKYRNATRGSLLTLVDSEVGREDLLAAYEPHGLRSEQVAVLPFTPVPEFSEVSSDREVARIRKLYGLPSQYLFYPAQFWPHKNHGRLVAAIGILALRGLGVHVVLCGGRRSRLQRQTFQMAMGLAEQMGIRNQVHYIGYAPDHDMPALYRGARSLVFPTFFGPTNIPVMEAWAQGCPVVTSNIRGIRDQCGDAALLVNPCDVSALADALERVWIYEDVRQRLIVKGRERLKAFTPARFERRLGDLLGKVKEELTELV